MNSKIHGIGFDLGDTLLYYRDTPMNWSSLYPEALRRVAHACRANPTPEQLAAAAQILTRHNTRIVPRTREIPAAEIFTHILRAWDQPPDPHLPPAIDAFFTFFQQRLSVYPETLSVLATLRQQAIPTGILTDVPYGMPRAYVQRDLDAAGLSGYFDTLLTSVEVGVRKPETAGYHTLAARLGLAPHEMLYIGNEPKDVIGARRAGLTAIYLDRARTNENHGQHLTLPDLSTLPELITRKPL